MKVVCIFVKIVVSCTPTPSGGGTHILINDNINDSGISDTSTWSSSKINENITNVKMELTEDYNNKIKIASPINILDNSDFRNPVNQRGVTDWNYIGYGIDRWFTNGVSANISVTGNGLQGSANFLVQRFEKDKLNNASKVTAAVRVNGTTYSGVLDISGFKSGVDIPIISDILGIGRVNLYNEDDSICQLYFANINSTTIEWAALYIGEYTTETLPEYHPKGYTVEMLECQRYFVNVCLVGNTGYVTSDKQYANFNVTIPTKMRIIPTASFTNTDNLVGIKEDGQLAVIAPTSIRAMDTGPSLGVTLSADLSTFTAFSAVSAFSCTAQFSADL